MLSKYTASLVLLVHSQIFAWRWFYLCESLSPLHHDLLSLLAEATTTLVG